MSKHKKQKRTIIGKMQRSNDIWITEEEVSKEFAFLKKLHPSSEMEQSIQFPVNRGYISLRITSEGKRQFRCNREVVQTAIDALPDCGVE